MNRPPTCPLIAMVLFGLALSPASAGSNQVDDYVDSLNSAEQRASLGIREVRRPGYFGNRLEVVFDAGVSHSQRAATLSKIAHEFVRTLARQQGITSATVDEVNENGTRVNRRTVDALGAPQLLAISGGSC